MKPHILTILAAVMLLTCFSQAQIAGQGAPSGRCNPPNAIGTIYTQTDAAAGQKLWTCANNSDNGWEHQTGPGGSACTGAAAGDVCYYDGATWATFTGNSSGSKVFTESASGVPSWGTGSAVTNKTCSAGDFFSGFTAPNFTCSTPTGGSVTPGSTIDFIQPVPLFNAAAQGGAGKSINCNFTSASAPSVDFHAGSATLPQFAAAQFPQSTAGTQYLECSYLLPDDFKDNTPYSLVAKMHTESATSGAVTWDVKFACTGADGSAIQPTYAALQKFAAVTITALEVEYTAKLAAPTFTCAHDQTLYTRFELNSDTTATGLIDMTNLQLNLVRAMVVQP
jgi:hypothetical protein